MHFVAYTRQSNIRLLACLVYATNLLIVSADGGRKFDWKLVIEVHMMQCDL